MKAHRFSPRRSPAECLLVVDEYLSELHWQKRTHKIQTEIRDWLAVRRLILADIEKEAR
jgi:hypothetical protein